MPPVPSGHCNHLHGQALPANFWVLVGSEVGLNIVFGLLTRAIDHSDAYSPIATFSASAFSKGTGLAA